MITCLIYFAVKQSHSDSEPVTEMSVSESITSHHITSVMLSQKDPKTVTVSQANLLMFVSVCELRS